MFYNHIDILHWDVKEANISSGSRGVSLYLLIPTPVPSICE